MAVPIAVRVHGMAGTRTAAFSGTIAPVPVLLDASPLLIDAPTLGAALSAARAAAEARRRVITDILLDGEPLGDRAIGPDAPAVPLGPASTLEFSSADPVELFQRSLRDAAERLDAVDTHQQAAAHAIQTGRFDRAMPSLSEAFTIWEGARKAVNDGCALLGLDPAGLTIEAGGSPVSLGAAIRVLLARLTEVKRCLSAQDWCGLSDVLAYELPADAALWRSLLLGLADNLPRLR